MPIKAFYIANYRGFSSKRGRVPRLRDGDFSSSLNLIVGPNSSGKSTILNAIRLAFGRDNVTSQGHHTERSQPRDAKAPNSDFHDPRKSFEVEVHYEWSAEARGIATRSCPGVGQPYSGFERTRRNPNGSVRHWHYDRLFAPGWPRLLTDLQGQDAFDDRPGEKNETFYRKAWPRVQEDALRYFGTRLDWILESPVDVILADGQPLLANSDGLAHLVYVMLEIEKFDRSATFLLEEPDAYLHPGLQRQFIEYIADGPGRRHQFLVTTHSPYVINAVAETMVGSHDKARRAYLFKTSMEGGSIRCRKVEPNDGWALLSHLGHRPSDVLQPNGIIWVEGPSDRNYVRTWLDAYAKTLALAPIRWGIDAEILWYGGATLKNVEATTRSYWEGARRPDAKNLLDLLRVSKNAVLVLDRDDYPRGGSATTKKRVMRGFRTRKLLVWMTEMGRRTVEDYVAPALAKECRIPQPVRVGWRDKVRASREYWSRAQDRPFDEVVDLRSDIRSKVEEVYATITSWRGHIPR